MSFEVGYIDPSRAGTMAMPPGDGNSYNYYNVPPAYRGRPPKSSKSKNKPVPKTKERKPEAVVQPAPVAGPGPLPPPVKGIDVYYASDIGRTRAIIKNTALLQTSENWRQLINVQELVIEDDDGNLRLLPDDIVNLRHLQAISIRWSRIKGLSPSFGGLPITHANLSHNKLQALTGIETLSKLKYLDVSCNMLTSLPDNIDQLKTLRQLRASGNKLRVLPDAIGNMASLVELVVSSNRLKCLPETLSHRATLKCLDFGMNQVTTLPVRMDGMKGLVQLVASYNRLAALPASLQYCVNLRHMFLRHNYLKELPEFLRTLTMLESINAQCNEISEVKCSSASLKSLLLDGNNLKVIPDTIFSCVNLNNLALSENGLTEVSTDIKKLSGLRILNLAHNQLQTLPKEVCELREIRHLMLNNNQIKMLPLEIAYLSKLAVMTLEGNEGLDGQWGTTYRQGGTSAVRELARKKMREGTLAHVTSVSSSQQLPPAQVNGTSVPIGNPTDRPDEVGTASVAYGNILKRNGENYGSPLSGAAFTMDRARDQQRQRAPQGFQPPGSPQTLDRKPHLRRDWNHNEARNSRPNSLVADKDKRGSKYDSSVSGSATIIST